MEEAEDKKLNIDLTAGQKGGLQKQTADASNTALPSDLPPDEDPGFDQDTLTSNFDRVTKNAALVQKVRAKGKSIVSEKKKELIVNIFNEAMKTQNTTDLIKDELDYYGDLNSQTLKKVNESIDRINQLVHQALKVHGRAISGWSKLPHVSNYEKLDFLFKSQEEEGIHSFISKFRDFAEFETFFQNIQTPITEVERAKMNAPQFTNIGKRLEIFFNWLQAVQVKKDLNKPGGYGFFENINSEMKNLVKNAMRLEIYEAITEELKKKFEVFSQLGDAATPVQKADILSRIDDEALAKDPEIAKALQQLFSMMKKQTKPTESEPIMESANNEPMTSRGKFPGQAKETRHALDVANDQKKKVENAYQQYLKTKAAPDPKTDKPDDFTFLIG